MLILANNSYNAHLLKQYYCVVLSKVTEFVATVTEVPEEVSESLQTFQRFFSRLSYTIRHPDLVQDLCEHGIVDQSTEVGGWTSICMTYCCVWSIDLWVVFFVDKMAIVCFDNVVHEVCYQMWLQ